MADDGTSPPPERSATGDPILDDWDSPPRLPTVPVLHLDGFDGPIDVLLDLAERQRVDLGRLSILTLVEQFLAAMDRVADKVPLEERADWIIIATRLVLLRSKLLFPESPDAAADQSRGRLAAGAATTRTGGFRAPQPRAESTGRVIHEPARSVPDGAEERGRGGCRGNDCLPAADSGPL